MSIINKIIKDIDEKLLFGEEKKLEYRFPNKHMIEIILGRNDLEFYYVPTEEIRGKLTLARFINKNGPICFGRKQAATPNLDAHYGEHLHDHECHFYHRQR